MPWRRAMTSDILSEASSDIGFPSRWGRQHPLGRLRTDAKEAGDSNMTSPSTRTVRRVALIEAGSPGLNIYSHVAMGRGTAMLATVTRDAGYEVRAFIEDVSGKGSV